MTKIRTKPAIGLFVVILWIGLLAGEDTSAAYQPAWLQTHLDGSLKMVGLYHGISFAAYKTDMPGYGTLRLAKDRALDELSYQLSVTIHSKFEDRIMKTGDFEQQQIASSLFISTRKILSGVQEKKTWTDVRKRRHWVLLVIDKDKADQQINQQRFMHEVVDRLEHKQDEVLKGIRQMASILETAMLLYRERMNRFEDLLVAIDTKVASSGDRIKDEYASLRQEIKRLESSSKAHADSLTQSEKRQSNQIKKLIAQNQELKILMERLTKRIQADYFLALANDDLQYKDTRTDFQINIKPDKGQGADYYDGEKVHFRVHASHGCYIKVIYISSIKKGSGEKTKLNTLLFPNEHDPDNWIDAGQAKIIGRLGEIEVQPPFGKDIVTVVASQKQFSDLLAGFDAAPLGYYSENTTSTRGAIDLRTRGIAVVPLEKTHQTQATNASAQSYAIATDTCFIVSHPN